MQEIHPSAWVAPSAELYGRVLVAEDASLWPQCVARAELHEVRIGRGSNVQDFVMLHVGYAQGVRVGARCSITHHATLHGCTVEDDCLIGIGAVVMDGATIGRGSVVAPGAVVIEGTQIPPHSIVAGVPAKVIRTRDMTTPNRENAARYVHNARAYARGEHRAWDVPDLAALDREPAERAR